MDKIPVLKQKLYRDLHRANPVQTRLDTSAVATV